jgi:hypothetical protein
MPNSGQPTIVPGVGFQNSAAVLELGFYASRSCSLMRPPRTGRRFIRSWERSATGWSGRGGWSWRLLYPQPLFSVASRSISVAISALTGGRPVRCG